MDEVLRHLKAIAPGLPLRHGGEPPWTPHRLLVGRGLDYDGTLRTKLAELRRRGLVESCGRGRNRHHALTADGLVRARRRQ